MPVNQSAVVCSLLASVLALGCQMEDQGLQNPTVGTPPAPPAMPPPGPLDGVRPPSIDPPATTPPVPVPMPVAPVPVPDAGMGAPIDNPNPGPPPEPTANCSLPRPVPFAMRVRNPTVESDEVVFDPDGQLLVIRNSDVVMLDGTSVPDPILRSVLGTQGGALRFMADGSLLVADFSGDRTTRYALPGRRELFRADTRSPMKMTLGPQGRLYVSSRDGFIYLVNTSTGARQVVGTPDAEVGGLAFSPDYRTLYAGLLQDQAIAGFPVGAQGQLGARTILAQQIPFPMALAADECGNLYTSGGPDGDVRRINPAGRVDVVVQTNRPQLWGMAFGSGKHGWSDTALYLTSDSDGSRGLFEIQVGLRGAPPPSGETVP